jgi:hypothetical protein
MTDDPEDAGRLPGALWADDAWADEPESTPDRSPFWMRAAMAVVAVAYLAVAVHGVWTVVGDLLDWASENALSWPGATPVSGREPLREDVRASTVQGVSVAAVGVVLGLWWRRRLAVAVFGGALVIALVAGLTTYALAAEDQPQRPDVRPRVCQEHSGGGNECPGD